MGLDRYNAANGKFGAAAAKSIDKGACKAMPACLT
jgi:hypothetical protein